MFPFDDVIMVFIDYLRDVTKKKYTDLPMGTPASVMIKIDYV